MSSRKQTRPRPTSRQGAADSFKAVLSRRRFIEGSASAALAGGLAAAGLAPSGPARAGEVSSLTFTELARVRDPHDHWPEGYRRQVLVRWGDPRGRLWIRTDGPGKALPRLFYVPPVGAACCGPWFNPDGTALFVSVQHPGELRLEDGEDATSLTDAGTSWPDFSAGMPARPALVVLSRVDGHEVGA